VTAQTTRPDIPTDIVACGVVAIARGLSPDLVLGVAKALAEGGLRAFEITMNGPAGQALRAIEAVASRAQAIGLTLGAGTVLSIENARQAVEAGATFLVMPHIDTDLVAWGSEHGIPVFPGAATPTEVLAAWRAGAAAVKLYPASTLGPDFVRELAGPFPDIPVVPTGGVTAETAGSFIAAGAVAVGLGGWLVGDGRPTGVTDRARQVVSAVAAVRGARPA